MIKVLAQLQNLHCGNDSQGDSKKVSIHASSVGYANYMASMRLKKIELKVKEAKKSRVLQMRKLIRLSLRKLASLLQRRTVLLSRTRWSICQLMRFDGYGVSNYSANNWEALGVFKVANDIQPFYQPNGPSHIGG
ncbi:hypothetical protein Focb16_v005192 [Fusarium oxysporum f. sp. cubense]|uniref:Uncharacterized protein n=1 Tax=Fusarium oxysporum f. sp. cubense TaxID=61366 RepID=A0A559LM80_FUSOC|nr:hypothetical protein Focb16_v005192 [Fusarium oxysporum f. sp. cubense]